MLKNFTLIALSCFLIIFTGSCTKDSTGSSNAGGTSSYSFEGSPGSCSTPAVAGFYSAGITLNATNTLTFTVNVSVKGTYSINTTASNGVFFSGSGTFTTTGPQSVVLTGNGTPIKAGNFPFVPVTGNTCNFTLSFLNGPPSAVFTYVGSPTCTAPVISGTYASGVAMGSGNYVDLAVNVTTPGAYTVSTNNPNGISFSGSGAFTANGAQVIRLIGNGTPLGQGTFAYTPSGGCSFSITVAPPPPPASFTYDGAPGNCTIANISGAFVAGTALTSSSTIKLGVTVSVAGTYSVTTNPNNGVTFSASGVFSGTGAQTITLTSTNTPTAGGTFSYTPSGGCMFDITYTTGPPPPADYLKCTIDGTFIDFNSGLISLLSGGSFSVSGDFGSSSLNVSLTDNAADIAVGSYNKFSLSNMNKYCLVTYTPNTGSPANFWLPGLMNSNPFTVTVQSITTSPNKITGIFSGDLFDGTGGNKKVVTNGSFSVGY